MRKLSAILAIISVIALCSGFLSCTTGGINPPERPAEREGRLLYVEDVDLPETITANQPFEIKITVSMQQAPALLGGRYPLEGGFYNFISEFPSAESNVLRVSGWYIDYDFEPGPAMASRTLTYEVQGFAAGQYSFEITSAKTPELGGSTAEVNVGNYFSVSENDFTTVKSYPFTVEPAP